jgi:uncharacterized protein
MKKTIKVLNIDGGGIRGLIAVIILAYIEEVTKIRIALLFDLIVGTSTGGIVTLGLTKPNHINKPQYSATDLIKFYEIEGPKIFQRSIRHKMFPIPLFQQKFRSRNIELVLAKYFGNTMLSEATNDILIPSFDVETLSPYFFKRHKARNNPEKSDFLMRDVALSTSAAPTYFPPYKLKSQHPAEPEKVLIDGGLFANNPSLCGYVEAKWLYRETEHFLVVSIGTGNISRRVPFKAIKHAGIAGWSRHLLDIVFDGISDTVHYQLEHLLCTIGSRNYYRFQADVKDNAIDDASAENIQFLKLIAYRIIEERNHDLNELCDKLMN